MPVRRHHEKSRHGCIQCKARKVKCDETKPICGGCSKRGAKCSFEDATSSFVFVSEFNGPRNSKGTTTSTTPAPAPATATATAAAASASTPSSTPTKAESRPAGAASYAPPAAAAPPPPSSQYSQPAGASSLPPPPISHGAPTLPPPTASHVLPRIDAPSPSSNPLSPPAQPSGGSSSGVFTAAERDNLRLMRHYVLFTYKAINNDPKVWSMWRDHVVELAYQHDFLLHMVLAISALHMAITDPLPHPSTASTSSSSPSGPATPATGFSHPSPSTVTTTSSAQPSLSSSLSAAPYALALHHHTLGVSLFRPHMGSAVTPATIQPCFAFAALLGVFAFGNPRAQRSPPDILPEIIHGMTLLRGTRAIVMQGIESLKMSPMSVIMLPQAQDPYAPLAPRVEAALAALNARNDSIHGGLPEIKEAYEGAINVLRNAYLLLSENPTSGMIMVPFTIMLPDRAISGMRAGEPMALCILAYYAVLLHELDSHVWLKGMGKQVVKAVWQEVDDDWRECLRWAVEDVGVFEMR